MTAFENYLLNQTTDKETLAGLLFMEIYENDNPQVWSMLEAHQKEINLESPDKITRETFEAVAEKLLVRYSLTKKGEK